GVRDGVAGGKTRKAAIGRQTPPDVPPPRRQFRWNHAQNGPIATVRPLEVRAAVEPEHLPRLAELPHLPRRIRCLLQPRVLVPQLNLATTLRTPLSPD